MRVCAKLCSFRAHTVPFYTSISGSRCLRGSGTKPVWIPSVLSSLSLLDTSLSYGEGFSPSSLTITVFSCWLWYLGLLHWPRPSLPRPVPLALNSHFTWINSGNQWTGYCNNPGKSHRRWQTRRVVLGGARSSYTEIRSKVELTEFVNKSFKM